MEYCSVQATKEDFDRCLVVVSEYMKNAGFNLKEIEFELLTSDIMETSAMMGGDFSSSNIAEICQNYIDSDFYSRFVLVHKDKLRQSFIR